MVDCIFADTICLALKRSHLFRLFTIIFSTTPSAHAVVAATTGVPTRTVVAPISTGSVAAAAKVNAHIVNKQSNATSPTATIPTVAPLLTQSCPGVVARISGVPAKADAEKTNAEISNGKISLIFITVTPNLWRCVYG